MKRYIDTNIFLNSVLYTDEKAAQCINILSKIIERGIIGVTSVLTWDEFIYVIHKNLGKETAIKTSPPNVAIFYADVLHPGAEVHWL